MAFPEPGTHGAAAGERHGGGRGGPTPPREIGFAEIRELVGRSWRLIGLCALLAGLVATLLFKLLATTQYVAEAKLLITPMSQGYAGQQRSAVLYQVLATSDAIVERAIGELITEGVLPEDTVLKAGRELDARMPQLQRDGQPNQHAFLVLKARHPNPQTAAAIVNGWADTVVEEGNSMFHGSAAGSELLLGSQLDPTDVEIARVRGELRRLLDDLRTREEEITIRWDRRISAARKRADEAVAEYGTATRRLMAEAVDRLLPSDPAVVDQATRSRLQEIVSVRSQLARTPRVLSLEKAASDETLSEALAKGGAVTRLDNTLVTEEINPLHDQLTVQLLGLESELKNVVGLQPETLAGVLAELERIQLERSAGHMALAEEKDLELRVLQLRRGRALEELLVEESRVRADHERELQRLTGLADELVGQLNRSVVSRVLDEVEMLKVAVPASPPQIPVSQQATLKVAVAIFLGGLLGLMIALFRSGNESA